MQRRQYIDVGLEHKLRKPQTFDQLIEGAKQSKEDQITKEIDDNIIPVIIDTLSHRMHDLSNYAFASALDLFKAVIKSTDEWFTKTGHHANGYRLSIGHPDHHGRTDLTIHMGVYAISRTVNLKAYITPDRLFLSTGENIVS